MRICQKRFECLPWVMVSLRTVALLLMVANCILVVSASSPVLALAPVPAVTQWRGEYFANKDLTGAPALVSTDPALDFDWGYNAPAAGLPADDFSVRWTGQGSFEAGLYRFHAVVDDGVRLYLDGQLVIDEWRDGARRELMADRSVTAGVHDLRVEYYERSGVALIRLWWEKATASPAWKGEYWSNRDLEGNPALVRGDPALDFDWSYNAPADGLPADDFSARWTRQVSLEGGLYRFHLVVDDGGRLYLDGQLIIDEWRDGARREVTADRTVSAGVHDLRVEYYEHGGEAVARLWWDKVTASSNWQGEYWSNRNLEGNPALVRGDPALNFDWGYDAPADGLPADDFSARWTRQVSLDQGLYRIHLVMDDGGRLYLDGQLVIDDWQDGAQRELTVDRSLSAGVHTFRVEYYEHGGEAVVRVWWDKVTSSFNWQGEYWSNRELKGAPALVRSDQAIGFDWGDNGPAVGFPVDEFSARWTRQLAFEGGLYRFHVLVDDGVRLYLDGQLVIDDWRDGARRELTADRSVSAGNHDVRLEYYEHGGQALISLWWESLASQSDWKGEYWSNPSLDGYPALIRNDPAINFNWGMDGPGGGVPSDYFSARWTRNVYFDAGSYRFHAWVDDGVRIWVDDQRVLDAWSDHSLHEVTETRSLSRGTHTVKVEYYDSRFDAQINVWWERVANPSYPEWEGQYWANYLLGGDPTLVRNDSKLDFDWGKGSPGEHVPADNFSARWTRDVKFDSGTYRFYAYADDGVRLYIDGKRVLDEWHSSQDRTYTVDVHLSGEHKIKVEFYERYGDARLHVWWEWLGSLRTS
jgi:hypothetical protein